MPSIAHGGELFLDEEAKWQAELAAIEKSGDYPITVANAVRFSPNFPYKIKEGSVMCDLDPTAETSESENGKISELLPA